jgi:hypothetical protein
MTNEHRASILAFAPGQTACVSSTARADIRTLRRGPDGHERAAELHSSRTGRLEDLTGVRRGSCACASPMIPVVISGIPAASAGTRWL